MIKHFEVKKWVRSQTALKETVTFDKLLQHAKQHKVQLSRTFTNTSPTEESQCLPQSMRSEPSQEKAKDLGLEPGPEVRVRVCGKCGTSHPPRECPVHGAKSVINVEIRIILVLNVGPDSQEEGTDGPAAHPEDVRAKANVNSPG